MAKFTRDALQSLVNLPSPMCTRPTKETPNGKESWFWEKQKARKPTWFSLGKASCCLDPSGGLILGSTCISMLLLGVSKQALAAGSYLREGRWNLCQPSNVAPIGPVMPSSFHDADGEAVRAKAQEEKREEGEQQLMGVEDERSKRAVSTAMPEAATTATSTTMQAAQPVQGEAQDGCYSLQSSDDPFI